MLVREFGLRLDECQDEATMLDLLVMTAAPDARIVDAQLFEAGKSELVLVAQRGMTAPAAEFFRSLPLSAGTACARAARLRRPVAIKDVRRDPEYVPFVPVADELGYRAVYSTPMCTPSGELVGVVSALFADADNLPEYDTELMTRYGHVVAEAIAKRRLER